MSLGVDVWRDSRRLHARLQYMYDDNNKKFNSAYDTTRSAAPDTISVYYDTAKFSVVNDVDHTVLCLSDDYRRLPINDKRHYAWTFQNKKTQEHIRIIGAHLASGNTEKDYINRTTDLASDPG